MPRIAMLSTAHVHSRSFLTTIAQCSSHGAAYAIWDDMPDRGRAFATEFNTTFVGDLDALLADDRVDGFVICAENTRHLPLLEKALPVGKPVLCEKPLTTSVADARRVAALLAEHNTPLTSGYFLPFSAENQGALKLIQSGELGNITHVTSRNAHAAAYMKWFDTPERIWFADPDLAGGGALMDMGTHSVHWLRSWFGPVEKVWVQLGNYSGHYSGVDDHGVIELQFASGIVGRVEASWCFHQPQNGLEVFGSNLSIRTADADLITVRTGEQPRPVESGVAVPDRIHRLVAMIQGQVDPQVLADDLAACLDAVAIIEAAYTSAKTGTWQPVEPVGTPIVA